MTTVDGASGSGAVRPYDFRSPERLTSRVRDRLSADQSRLAPELALALSKALRSSSTVEFREIREGGAGEFLAAPADAVFRLSGASAPSGLVLLRLEAGLAQAFVDGLLGGSWSRRDVDREPTEIEIAVMGPALEQVGKRIADVLPLYPVAGESVYLAPRQREALRSEDGITCSFEFRLGETTGGIHLFYGYGVIDRLQGETPGAEGGSGEAGEETVRMSADHLGRVKLNVTVRFRPEPVRIRDVVSLEVGDVLYLDRALSDEVELRIGNRVAFLAHPGTVDGEIGVQIARAR